MKEVTHENAFIGMRVVRSSNWPYTGQDEDSSGKRYAGTIKNKGKFGSYQVEWDHGYVDWYDPSNLLIHESPLYSNVTDDSEFRQGDLVYCISHDDNWVKTAGLKIGERYSISEIYSPAGIRISESKQSHLVLQKRCFSKTPPNSSSLNLKTNTNGTTISNNSTSSSRESSRDSGNIIQVFRSNPEIREGKRIGGSVICKSGS